MSMLLCWAKWMKFLDLLLHHCMLYEWNHKERSACVNNWPLYNKQQENPVRCMQSPVCSNMCHWPVSIEKVQMPPMCTTRNQTLMKSPIFRTTKQKPPPKEKREKRNPPTKKKEKFGKGGASKGVTMSNATTNKCRKYRKRPFPHS